MHEEYILYHSTPMHNLSTIQMFGLVAGSPPLWENWSQPGYLYFSSTAIGARFWSLSYLYENIIEPEFHMRYPKFDETTYNRLYEEDPTKFPNFTWVSKVRATQKDIERQLASELIVEGIAILKSAIPSKFLEFDLGSDMRTKKNIPPDRISVYKLLDKGDVVKFMFDYIKRMPVDPYKLPKSIKTDRKWKGKDI
jgi:hypothetical protein